MIGNFIGVFFFLLAIAGMIAGTIFWIFMIVECATKEADTGNTKIVWIIIVVFTHIIGALLYYFVRRPERRRELPIDLLRAVRPEVRASAEDPSLAE